MKNLPRDVRYALRQFRQSPVFTLAAVLTLALGIGGTTAIFSLIHAVMLRSLPVADPASLYRIGNGNSCCVEGGPQDNWGMYSFPLYQRLKAAAPEFEELAAFQSSPAQFSVRRAGVEALAKPLRAEFVTGNYFSTFGIRPFAGRLFTSSDDRPSAPPVAVLSYRLWQESYGADPTVVGASFIIEGQSFTISGIAPPGFFGETLRSDPPDVWVPLQQEPLISGSGTLLHQSISAWLRVIGRLRPGATVAGMSPRLTTVLRQWILNESGYPPEWMPDIRRMIPRQNIRVVPAGAGVAEMREDYTRSLQILLTVCGLVLLIACANIANLLLARGMARRSQTAVRLAIGASRVHLIRQSLIECVLLALAGGAAGLLVADVSGRLILALAFHGAHFLPISTAPSLPVMAFAFLLSLVTGVVFGVAPAWFATRTDPVEALRGAGRSTRGGSSLPRRLLLVVQAALSIVLVAGAAMLARSLSNLERQNFGIQTANRVTISLNSPPATYTPDHLTALYRDLEDRLKQVPRVQQAGLALYNPFTDNWGDLIFVSGHPAPGLNYDAVASWDRVSPGYFNVVGQPVLRGRGFMESDSGTAAPVAVVNEAFVRKFLPKEEPLDKHFGIDMPANAGMFRIVGVVRDAKYTDPGSPARPMFFVPMAQYVTYNHDLMQKIELRSHFIGGAVVVTQGSMGNLEPMLRKAFSEADPNLTVISVRTMQEQIDLNFDQQRAVASLAGLFGIVALTLAAVGLYGITAYAVAQRTGEIGLRMALGADRVSVIQLVLRSAFQNVAFGLLLGIPLAIGAGRLISAQLYGVVNWDPMALLVATGSLGACAFVAAIIPAIRAASIAPLDALRME
ncbi:MAG: ABC transporter permease [Acidobacteriia bacterium]|nr:ABC transporter permease [Terriglobia bacterium]